MICGQVKPAVLNLYYIYIYVEKYKTKSDSLKLLKCFSLELILFFSAYICYNHPLILFPGNNLAYYFLTRNPEDWLAVKQMKRKKNYQAGKKLLTIYIKTQEINNLTPGPRWHKQQTCICDFPNFDFLLAIAPQKGAGNIGNTSPSPFFLSSDTKDILPFFIIRDSNLMTRVSVFLTLMKDSEEQKGREIEYPSPSTWCL